MTVVADDERFTGRTHNVIIANAGYFGGGMRISPHSDPIDGVVDLQINIGPKRQAVTLIPKIFKGRHLPDKRIVQMSGRTGSVDAASPPSGRGRRRDDRNDPADVCGPSRCAAPPHRLRVRRDR